MAHIEWNNRFSTGIAEVDSEHQKLIELINQLHQAMVLGLTRRELPAIIGELIDYTHQHFQHEESLMALHNYPGAEKHRELHAHFTDMVVNFRSKLEQGDFAISTSLFVLLQNWLIEHIMGADQEFSRHALRETLNTI